MGNREMGDLRVQKFSRSRTLLLFSDGSPDCYSTRISTAELRRAGDDVAYPYPSHAMLSPEAFVRWLRLGVGAAFVNSKPTPPDPTLSSNSERLSHLEDPSARTSLGPKAGVVVPNPWWRRGGNTNRLAAGVAVSLALSGVYMWAYTFNEKDHDGVTSGAKASWRPVFDPGSNPATELIGASKFDKPSGTHDKSVMEHQLAADESGRNLPAGHVHQQDSVNKSK